MYYYFYKITNNINGKYYYGVHSTTNINDGYMGSGKRLWNAYNKYGQSNFTKTIMRYFVDKDDMYEYEKLIVNKDLVKDPNCYNLSLGGGGSTGWTISLSDEEKKQHSKKMSDIMRPIMNSQKYHDNMSKATSGKNNPMYGYQWSEEQNKKRSELMYEVYKDPVHKQNLMNGIAKRSQNKEWRKNISEYRKNKCLVYNNSESKYIPKDELQTYLDNGWKRGRRPKNKSTN